MDNEKHEHELIEGFTAGEGGDDVPQDVRELYARAREIAQFLDDQPDVDGRRGAGGVDINQILQMLTTYGPIIAALIAQIQASRPKPTPAPPAPTPEPTQPAPPVVTQPPNTGFPPPPVQSARRIASLRTRWLGWEDYSKRPGEKQPYHHTVGAQGILNGDPVGNGYRGHVDITPVDQNGVAFQNADMARFPQLFAQNGLIVVDERNGKYTAGEGNNRFNYYVEVDGQVFGPMGDLVQGRAWEGQSVVGLTSEYDEGGCTPVILINYDNPLSVERRIRFRADYVAPDGSVVSGPWTSMITVKPWAVD